MDAIEALAVALGVEENKLFEAAASTTKPPAVLVTCAKDGSCFSPAMLQLRAKTFAVGEKDNTRQFIFFEAAFDYLMIMKTAKWWRPGKNGKPYVAIEPPSTPAGSRKPSPGDNIEKLSNGTLVQHAIACRFHQHYPEN